MWRGETICLSDLQGISLLIVVQCQHCVWCWTCETMFQNTHLFNGPLSRTTRVSQYQKGKTNLDFTEARDSEWQWHLLAYASLHLAPLKFFTGWCPSCRPANSVKALKACNVPEYSSYFRANITAWISLNAKLYNK